MTKTPRFSRLELVVMEALWAKGQCSVREILESLPAAGRPAFTTLQTIVYRLEAKRALRCAKRVGNANVFEAVISRDTAERHLLDEVVRFFGGGLKGVMAHLIETGQLTLTDVEEAEKALRAAKRKKGGSR